MASKQAGAIVEMYRRWLAVPAADPEWTEADNRLLMGEWDMLTTEPGGVDYLEVDAAGVRAMWARPRGAAPDRVLLCLHGGGYVAGSIYTHRKMYAHLAKAVGATALLVDYRLLPEGVHPAPVRDVVTVYGWLLGQGIAPESVVFAGDSAGGGMAILAQLHARAMQLPQPAAALLVSPWTDMEVAGETMVSNAGKDALFNHDWVKSLASNFLAGADPRDPMVNVLCADLTGLGPVFIQVGDQELLLDDARALAAHLEKCGVDVRIDVFAEMQHSFQMMAGRAPEADDAIARLADWVRPKLPA